MNALQKKRTEPESQTLTGPSCSSKPNQPYQFSLPALRLVLSTGLGELENDTASGQAPVDLGVGVESVVNAATLLLVKNDLEGLGAVLLGAEALADNLDGVDEVGQDCIMDSGKSARTGALLLLGVARAGGALGAGENTTRSEDEDVAVRELLLQLTGQATALSVMRVGCKTRRNNLPLLDTVEALQRRDGDKDDNSLLAVANLDL